MIKYYNELEQGSQEWLQARCGLLTASTIKNIVTPTCKVASNDKSKAFTFDIMAQRITKRVEPIYVSEDMERGSFDEIIARNLYSMHYAEVKETGFITNDKFGFKIGYSPDGLVAPDGLIEIKSRKPKYQLQTIIDKEVPKEYMIQLQVGLLVSERKWIDFISYSAGLPMFVKRVYPDEKIQKAIIEASGIFETVVKDFMSRYEESSKNFIMTERNEIF